MGTIWNAADQTNMTLSGGSLTATPASAAVAGCRGTVFRGASAGKVQLQFTNVTFSATFDMIGIGDAGQALTGETSNGNEFMVSNSGSIYGNNNGFTGFATPANCTIDMCLDLVNKLGWARVNGSAWSNVAGGAGDPAAGTGGITILGTSWAPFVELTGLSAHATLNPVPTGLVSGFSAWDPGFAYAQARLIG